MPANPSSEAEKLLNKVGPGNKHTAWPASLSDGQQQPVGIARALVMKILADGGMTMVIVTHEIGFAREVADHILFIDDRVIQEQGNPSQLFNARIAEFLSKTL